MVDSLARLPVHFDVPEHSLSASHYVAAVKAIQTCLDEINRRAFHGRLEIEFLVLPGDEGSFKGVTAVLVKGYRVTKGVLWSVGALASTIELSETSTFKGLVKGLTGNNIEHYDTMEKAGRLLRDMVIGTLSIKNDHLDKIIPHEINLDKALKAKSDFYYSCLSNIKVRGIGFDDSDNFPIRRSEFPFHLTKDRVRPAKSEFRLCDVVIVSPVNVDRDTKWTFQDNGTKEVIRAHMRDMKFRRDFLRGRYPLKESVRDDEMKVLIEYVRDERNGEIEVRDVLIDAVYEFNSEPVAGAPEIPADAYATKDEGLMPLELLWKE